MTNQQWCLPSVCRSRTHPGEYRTGFVLFQGSNHLTTAYERLLELMLKALRTLCCVIDFNWRIILGMGKGVKAIAWCIPGVEPCWWIHTVISSIIIIIIVFNIITVPNHLQGRLTAYSQFPFKQPTESTHSLAQSPMQNNVPPYRTDPVNCIHLKARVRPVSMSVCVSKTTALVDKRT